MKINSKVNPTRKRVVLNRFIVFTPDPISNPVKGCLTYFSIPCFLLPQITSKETVQMSSPYSLLQARYGGVQDKIKGIPFKPLRWVYKTQGFLGEIKKGGYFVGIFRSWDLPCFRSQADRKAVKIGLAQVRKTLSRRSHQDHLSDNNRRVVSGDKTKF